MMMSGAMPDAKKYKMMGNIVPTDAEKAMHSMKECQ
jgi:hypothetical protein